PQPVIMSEPREKIPGGVMVEVLEYREEWVSLRYGTKEGWLPAWYLSEDPEPLVEVNSGYLVLNRDTGGLLYPAGPRITDLARGRLLLPLREWNSWAQVEIILYSVPGVSSAWIPKNLLSPVKDVTPTEGFLKEGTPVYEVEDFNQIAKAAPQAARYDMSVILRLKRDGYINVEAAGGWTAWTRLENLQFSR
ncbi:MAG: SH3 domain-containing protein, partial [Desulfocucumaceae bacterium]